MNERKLRKQCETIELCIAEIMRETGETRDAAYRRAFHAYACTPSRTRTGTTREYDASTTRTRAVKNIITTNNNINNNNKIKQRESVLCNSTPAPAQVFCLDFLLKNAPKSIPSWYVRYWFKTMDQRGWQTKEGQIVGPTNWPYYLGTFYSHASEEERAQAKRYGQEAQYAAERKARFANQKFDWTLCRERCANFRDGYCSRGILVPPSAGEFPVPPEICPDFKHRND